MTNAETRHRHADSPSSMSNVASEPTWSKRYCTNRREEEGLLWPFTPSRAVHNRGVDNVRKRQQIYKEYSMRYTHTQLKDGGHYVWYKEQTAIWR